MVSSPDDDVMGSRMDHDIDELDLTEKEASSCQRKRKQTQERAVDEPKRIKVSENKRRKLEKPLCAQQRNQVMVKVAKEEPELKKNL